MVEVERAQFPVVAHVLLLRHDDQEVFMLRRANTGFLDGAYTLPGGHQHPGEDISAAALRECREEAGVAPEILRPTCVLSYRTGDRQGVNFVFEANEWQGVASNAEPERCDEARWCSVSALPQPHPPWISRVLALRGRGQWFAELH